MLKRVNKILFLWQKYVPTPYKLIYLKLHYLFLTKSSEKRYTIKDLFLLLYSLSSTKFTSFLSLNIYFFYPAVTVHYKPKRGVSRTWHLKLILNYIKKSICFKIIYWSSVFQIFLHSNTQPSQAHLLVLTINGIIWIHSPTTKFLGALV